MTSTIPPAPCPPEVQISWHPLPRNKGAGLSLACGHFKSPFGPVQAIGTMHGLWALGFAGEMGAEATKADLARRWSKARLVEAPDLLAGWVEAVFAPEHGQPVPAAVHGSAFDMTVWQALLAIPPGKVPSYGALASALGVPGAARAVGGAVGRNPLAWLIPCHRVVPASGGLGGYRWGVSIKRALLSFEGAPARQAP